MPGGYWNRDDNNRDREDRIRDLKRQAEQAAGGDMVAWEADTLSPEEREEFWQRVVEFETSTSTTLFDQLTAAGVQLPEPDAMVDEELASKMWEVVSALARMHVFIRQTDHLSDRELYELLWRDLLREEIPMALEIPGSAWCIDLLGTGSEADTHLYLKYYADEDWRQQWLAEFADYDMPEHENPPHDRDRYLPQPEDEPLSTN